MSARSSWMSPFGVLGFLTGMVILALPAPLVGQLGEGDQQSLRPAPGPSHPPAIERTPDGETTIRAFRVPGEFQLDGRLDEVWYAALPPITGFIQSLPDEGQPATEETEVWITYDEANVYVSARVWDSAPESEWIANEMRRDGDQVRDNDTFGVIFDTFHDRRNGAQFYTNPLGAMVDIQVSNERTTNRDWNPIWDVRTGRFDGGWTVEMEIPFKTLRYHPGTQQTWGVQLRRVIRRRNEWTHITLIPRAIAGTGAAGWLRISESATLIGLEAPPPSRNLEIKPYGISGLQSSRDDASGLTNETYVDAGLDVKYGITPSLTADLTFNTDFAQVEVDEQQVNLTRFNLQFPEKRDFFLEGRGIFDFAVAGPGAGGGGAGGAAGGGRRGGGGGGGGGEAPTLFFSRRIGLDQGEQVPIIAGGRLTGKLGSFDIGALNVQTDDDDGLGLPSTNFSVLRVRRDVLARSSIGALFTNRSASTVADGSNQTFGIDATVAFLDDFLLLGYVAKTRTPGLTGTDESYRGRFSYDGDLYGLVLDHVFVGDDFNPEVGFLRRDAFRQSSATARYTPRPASIEAIRQFTFQGDLDYLTSTRTGWVESRELEGMFRIEFENSDGFSVSVTDTYEFLENPFAIAEGVTIPEGRYSYQDVFVGYSLGSQRRFTGSLFLRYGSFYGGDRTSLMFSRGRIQVLPRLSIEPSASMNWVDLPEGSFRADVLSTRLNYSFTPRFFVSGLGQYNSSNDTFSSNVRLRWEYAPGSELFIVYTDERNTDVFDRFPELSNRGLVIKLTRMLRP